MVKSRAAIGRRSREKGQAYQRLVRKWMEAALPGTTWLSRIQPRGAKSDGPDILGADGAGDVVPLWIECHNGRTAPAAKLAQAVADAPEDHIAIAICHRPGSRYKSDVACLRMADLMVLLGGETKAPGAAVMMSAEELLALLRDWWAREGVPSV